MERFGVVTVMAALGRLIATVGAALTAGAVAGIVGGWTYSALHYAPDWNVGLMPLVLPLQLIVAGWVVRSLFRLGPRPLLRNLLLAFGGSFFLLYGWYFLLLSEGFGTISFGILLYLLAGLFVLPAALLGDAREPDEVRRERARMATGALGAVLFLSVAAVVGYRATPTPPEAQTLGPPDQPPLYCQEGKEEIASFDGRGDMVTPVFETTGRIWGYEFASTG